MKDKVNEYIKEMYKVLDKITLALNAPEGIRITVVNRIGFKVVEYWDGNSNTSIPLYVVVDDEVDKNLTANEIVEGLDGFLNNALTMVPITEIGKVKIEIISDLEYKDLSWGTKKGIEIIECEYNKISDDDLNEMKETYYHAINNMHQFEGAQTSG